MSDLSEFLLARIAEDETRVSAWYAASGPRDTLITPGRLLAECDAKRRIVEEHGTIPAAYPNTTIETDPCCETCSAGGEYPSDFPCQTLRLLALPYANHPDYDEESWLS